jgi:signal transduction histidine kinase
MGGLARGVEPAVPESATAPEKRGMSDRHLGQLAAAIAVASIAMAVVAYILGFARGSAVKTVAPETIQDVFNNMAQLAMVVLGAVIARRQPRNAIVWLMCLLGATAGLQALAPEYAYYTLLIHSGALPLGRAAAWLSWWTWAPGVLALPLFLLLFPNGRPLSRRWRWLVIAIVCIAVLDSAALAFLPSSSAWTGGPVPFQNPLGQPLIGRFGGVLFALTGPVLILWLLCGFASTILRYRRANQDERHQLKWFLCAAALVPITFAFGMLTPQTFGSRPLTPLVLAQVVLNDLATVSGPAAIAIAILKYRLYDIDVVINRTLVYGALAAFITAVYVGIVVGVGTLVGSGGQPNLVLSIIATAVVAVAFQPVRERLQKVANRLVYGQRATPYEVLSQFSERVAESYAADDVLPRMARVLADGTGAARAEVWLRAGDILRQAASWPLDSAAAEPARVVGDSLPEMLDTDRAVEVRHQGELLGALTITKRKGESLTPVEEKLLTDLAGQAGLVLKNVGLTAELLARLEDLRASRQRLVAAQDEERRRLERNLHDGAQQNLVALKIKLGLVEALADKDPARARQLLGEIKTDADEALETLRDLARGIYPPLLADKGLAAALEAQARKATLPVEVSANGIGRYPQDLEAAVYFCCLEALQNVQKYASAKRASVRLQAENGSLKFEVEDDGRGFDVAMTPRGSGLTNMADRLDALGGSSEVDSARGRGTRLWGQVPVLVEATV